MTEKQITQTKRKLNNTPYYMYTKFVKKDTLSIRDITKNALMYIDLLFFFRSRLPFIR